MNNTQEKLIENISEKLTKIEEIITFSKKEESKEGVSLCCAMMQDMNDLIGAHEGHITEDIRNGIGNFSFRMGVLTSVLFEIGRDLCESEPEEDIKFLESVRAQVEELKKLLGGRNE